MRELRVVEAGTDSEHVLVETLDGAERFSLRIDDVLRRCLSQEAAEHSPAPPVAIPPREIQVRVRAGEAPAVLADEVGMSIDRVLLFAGPVLDERSRMADEARRARARRSVPDGQLVTFGEAVDERFASHGIDPATVRWDSHRRDDGQWVVSAGWRGGESERSAEWTFSLSARTVAPLDETAADLLSDRPIRPVVSPVPDLPPVPASTPEATTGPLPRIGSRPAAGDEDLFEREQARADGADALPLHIVETVARPAGEGPVDGTADGDSRAMHPSAAGAPGASGGAGPSGPRKSIERHEDETDEQKAARARIPSWDDILLGVRRKRD